MILILLHSPVFLITNLVFSGILQLLCVAWSLLPLLYLILGNYMLSKLGSSAVQGKMFLVKIILKNLRTLKASNNQTRERIDYACTNQQKPL